jgi:hypothetical protein
MRTLTDLENHLQTIMEADKNGGVINIKEEAVKILALCNEIRKVFVDELNLHDVIKSVCSLCKKEIEVERESNIFCDECWETL